VLPQLSAPCNTVIGPSRAYVIEPHGAIPHWASTRLSPACKGRPCRGTRRVHKLAAARHVDFLSSPLQLIIKSEGKVALSASSSASRSNPHHQTRSLPRKHDHSLLRLEHQINHIPTQPCLSVRSPRRRIARARRGRCPSDHFATMPNRGCARC
jgi:hypothetical protein